MTDTAAMPLLEVRGLTKSFFGVEVLHGVGFDVQRGQALGLVGENGSGKSTSMNLLGGIHKPDSGRMLLEGVPYAPESPRDAIGAGIAFIHQELNLFANLSIEENLFIGRLPRRGRLPFVDRGRVRRRARELLAAVELDLPPQRLVSRLSQGERQLVEIAKALDAAARLIIFDEPTTSLTRREALRLFSIIDRLKQSGCGLIYISHTLDDVTAVCEQVTVLRDGAVVDAGPRASMTVPRMIAAMVGRDIAAIYPRRRTTPRAEPVLEVEGLSQRGVAAGIGFTIHTGEILGLSGLMGSGRSEIARMLFGLDRFHAGTIRVDGRPLTAPTPATAMAAGLAFLSEDRRGDGLMMDASIADTMMLASLQSFTRAGFVDGRRLERAAREQAGRVLLSTGDVGGTEARHLSGGNQQKVILAKWLQRRPRVFILDEPTRGIDVGARQEVYRLIVQLVEEGAAVLLISSEIEELIGLSDRILTLAKGELTAEFAREEFDREKILSAAMAPVARHRQEAA